MKINKNIFGLRVYQLRVEEELTQEEFAEKCNVSRTTVWRAENFKMRPRKDTLALIAAACNVSIDWLRGVKNERWN